MNKRLIILSLITLISVFMAYQVFALRMPEPTFVAASTDEYRWGTTDTNIAQMKSDIREIKSKIDNICAEVTKVQVQAARDGALYGGGSGMSVYLLGLLVQALKKKTK